MLMEACFWNNNDWIKRIVEAAPTTLADRTVEGGYSPLLIACMYDRLAAVQCLVDGLGVDVAQCVSKVRAVQLQAGVVVPREGSLPRHWPWGCMRSPFRLRPWCAEGVHAFAGCGAMERRVRHRVAH